MASTTPHVDPEGPQTWVPAERAIGALAHLDLPADFAEQLRATIDENVITEVADPFTRWEEQQAQLERERRAR